jgi:hypothetical protein
MATAAKKQKAVGAAPSRSLFQKELACVHDLCGQLMRLSESLGVEYNFRRTKG